MYLFEAFVGAAAMVVSLIASANGPSVLDVLRLIVLFVVGLGLACRGVYRHYTA